MSDYELIMLILEVITVVIAFGALVTSNWITERPFHQLFIVLR
ncbi:MAG: hypothetical protein E7C20_03590 [Veillonella sp.]|nr:hypothetical protein [Veillonella sp.]